MTSKLLALVLLLSSFGMAQGVAGDPGVGDSGSASGPSGSAPALEKYCAIDNSAGNAGAQSCTWVGGGLSTSGDMVGCDVYTSNVTPLNRTYTAATSASESMTIDSNGGTFWGEAWNGGTARHTLLSKLNASAATGATVTPSGNDYFVAYCYAFTNIATSSAATAGTPNHVGLNAASPWSSQASGTVTLGTGGYALLLVSVENGYGTTSLTYSAPTDAAGTYTQIGSTIQGSSNSGGMALFYRAASATTSVTASGAFTGAANYDLTSVISQYKGN